MVDYFAPGFLLLALYAAEWATEDRRDDLAA